MAVEIERKFLVRNTQALAGIGGIPYRQGYLQCKDATVRVRVAGNQGYLTIKGPTVNISRAEYEYEIPLSDAQQMLDTLCGALVEKTRYRLDYKKHCWEVDIFEGLNAGLVLAEVEIQHESESVALPDWIGMEVSGDYRYYNSWLAQNPYCSWS